MRLKKRMKVYSKSTSVEKLECEFGGKQFGGKGLDSDSRNVSLCKVKLTQ